MEALSFIPTAGQQVRRYPQMAGHFAFSFPSQPWGKDTTVTPNEPERVSHSHLPPVAQQGGGLGQHLLCGSLVQILLAFPQVPDLSSSGGVGGVSQGLESISSNSQQPSAVPPSPPPMPHPPLLSTATVPTSLMPLVDK